MEVFRVKVIHGNANQRVPVKAWTDGVEFEAEALEQVLNVASLPFVFKHVAVMPDVHWGIGATVGSVIATKGAIIPAAVGVDIGCGMIAQQTIWSAKDLPDDLSLIREGIEENVPHGRTDEGQDDDEGAWRHPPSDVYAAWESLSDRWHGIVDRHPQLAHRRKIHQLGTLGTGNHFIEICVDENDSVWVMLHSGSRGQGNAIGRYFIEQAKEAAALWMFDGWLPDKDLAWLPEGHPLFGDYMTAVLWAQDYAMANRRVMLDRVVGVLTEEIGTAMYGEDAPAVVDEVIACHHNYVARENHFNQKCARHAQRSRSSSRRRSRHHPRKHGRAQLHRARQRQRRFLHELLARSRPATEP